MALIICQECGREISDKSKACVHCGCPIEFSVFTSEVVSEEYVKEDIEDDTKIKKLDETTEELIHEKSYKLEITNCGESKMKLAELLSSEFKMKFREAMDKLNNSPCVFNENVNKRIFNVLLEEIIDTGVEYCLYEDDKLIKSKSRTGVIVNDAIHENQNTLLEGCEGEESEFNGVTFVLTICFICIIIFFVSAVYRASI